MSSPRRTRGSQTPSRNDSEGEQAPRTPRRQPVTVQTPSSRTRRGQAAGARTPARAESENSPPTRRTPTRSSRSGTPVSTPLRFGAQRPGAGQDNIVEPSDPLSIPPSSPGANMQPPTSPFGVGKGKF